MIIWILLCILVGYFAHLRGRNVWTWGIASFFFTPLIVGIVLAVMPTMPHIRETKNSDLANEYLDDEPPEDDDTKTWNCGNIDVTPLDDDEWMF